MNSETEEFHDCIETDENRVVEEIDDDFCDAEETCVYRSS